MRKNKNEGTENSIPSLFFVWLRLNATALKFLVRTDWGRTDFERKSLADEREAYKGTLSEETRIKQKNIIKTKNFGEIQHYFIENTKKYKWRY